MEDLDIQALAEKIGDHRFNGYTDSMLADEIDRFRSGRGASGLGDAVDALQAVAAALAETDRTLRTELGKLGVDWRGAAAARAGAVVADHATFSEEAAEKVTAAAKSVFAQGEAFNRTLHTLPESQVLRDGTGGHSVLDSVGSLLGFETDNAQRVARAREAREQALQALNTYARRSGEILSGVRPLDTPPTLYADTGRATSPAAKGRDVTTSTGATTPVAPGPGAPTGGSAGVSIHSAPDPGMVPPAQGPGARSSGGGDAEPAAASRQATTVSGTVGATATSAVPGVAAVAGVARAGQVDQLSSPPNAGTPAAGGAVPGSVPAAPGSAERPAGGSLGAAPGGSAAHGSGAGGSGGKVAGASGASAPHAGKPATLAVPGEIQQQPLPKGKSTGAGPVPSGIPAGGSSGAKQIAGSDGWSENAIGAGAAALGAGGIAGALSGDGERKGRGIGRSAPRAADSPRPLPVGDLPEEEERVQRTTSRLGEGSARTRDAFLREAAPRTDDEDAEHVRRFGVDDTDLFADERRVAPDVIGDADPRP